MKYIIMIVAVVVIGLGLAIFWPTKTTPKPVRGPTQAQLVNAPSF